jgi:hypothetical protein
MSKTKNTRERTASDETESLGAVSAIDFLIESYGTAEITELVDGEWRPVKMTISLDDLKALRDEMALATAI